MDAQDADNKQHNLHMTEIKQHKRSYTPIWGFSYIRRKKEEESKFYFLFIIISLYLLRI